MLHRVVFFVLFLLLRTTYGSENDEDLTEDERAAIKTAQEKYDKKKEEEAHAELVEKICILSFGGFSLFLAVCLIIRLAYHRHRVQCIKLGQRCGCCKGALDAEDPENMTQEQKLEKLKKDVLREQEDQCVAFVMASI